MAAKTHPITDEDEINHFQNIPWCRAHLATPNLEILPAFCRTSNHGGENALLAITLKTHNAIPAFILFYPRPQDEKAYLSEVKAFITLGEMVSGYAGISHGGIIATILDETTSFLIPGPRMRPDQPGAREVVTAYLHTVYRKPVVVPASYLITVRLKKAEGRKTWVEGVMENEHGETVAEADALFVEVREKL